MKELLIPFCLLLILFISCNTESSSTNEEDIAITNTVDERITLQGKTIKDTTSAYILDALYNNYNEKENYAVVDKNTISTTELKERAFDWNEENIMATLDYMADLGDGRFVYVVAVKPSEGYECRICAPLLGAGIIKVKGKGKEYYMGDFKYFDIGGTYGISPGFKIQKISNYDFALIEVLGDLHMGYNWSGEHFFSINNEFKSILNVSTFNDNSGACDMDNEPDSAFGPCYENSTSITYVPSGSDKDYYEIHTHQRGTEWDPEKGVINELDKKEVYTFVDGVYTLKE